jgi:hypothetical protein
MGHRKRFAAGDAWKWADRVFLPVGLPALIYWLLLHRLTIENTADKILAATLVTVGFLILNILGEI